jgi:hypothetical protein
MKSEIYNAIASINRSFDVTLESLTILKNEGVVNADYVQQQTEITQEIRAAINQLVLSNLEEREDEDRDHWGKMRIARKRD